MCDAFIYRDETNVWFCKNSDREPDEPQLVEFHPSHQSLAQQQTTYITVDVPERRNGVLLSRPSWIWGAEMGVNEHGVAIGNEAVYTKLINTKKSSLLGMDLLRLALEQAVDANQACAVIIQYLESYGQGGPAGYRDKNFRYDNAFIISDHRVTFILDTAGKFWAKKEVTKMAAISNDLSITTDYDEISEKAEGFARQKGWWKGEAKFNFRQAFRTRLMPWFAKSSQRRNSNLHGLQHIFLNQTSDTPISENTFISMLCNHKRGKPSSNADVCMHANGVFRPSATTNSFIVKLNGKDKSIDDASAKIEVWSSFGQPCQNEYRRVDWGEVTVNDQNSHQPVII